MKKEKVPPGGEIINITILLLYRHVPITQCVPLISATNWAERVFCKIIFGPKNFVRNMRRRSGDYPVDGIRGGDYCTYTRTFAPTWASNNYIILATGQLNFV